MKKILKSGATIEVSIAPVKTGFRLFQAIVQEFKKDGLGSDFTEDDAILDLRSIFLKNPQKFISGMLDVITSDKVIDLILECGASAVYTRDGVSMRVSMECFEDERAREDMFEVLQIIAQDNIAPFFPKARTKSKPTNE